MNDNAQSAATKGADLRTPISRAGRVSGLGRASRSGHLSPGQAVLLPVLLATALLALGLQQRSAVVVSWSILGAGVFLLIWSLFFYLGARRSGRKLVLEVELLKHHWLQVCTQLSIYAVWGWYVPPVRAFVPLVLAQLLFAYGFHTLLSWSRQERYGLGFGPVPIILSFNLFILFRPDWFYWQFGLIAIGFLCKEFIRWEKGGRSCHIFNPSSFALVVVSVVLIATGTTDRTLGVEIASWLVHAPNIHAILFLISIPVQLAFGVTTMTLVAFATVFGGGLAFYGLTGSYLFFDAYIPVAVFVGMLLLITDPSTAPRSESGRIVFGFLYGVGIMATFGLLQLMDVPAFYDKLLPVPLLNLMVRAIDRGAAVGRFKLVDFSGLGASLTAAQRRAAVVGLWGIVFVSVSAAGGVGDEHRGQWVPFWDETCSQGSGRACDHLATLEQNLCLANSGWACNELGILLTTLDLPLSEIGGALDRGCALNFPTACENVERLMMGVGPLVSSPPLASDLPMLLRGSKRPLAERDPTALFQIACERGFEGTCGAPSGA